MRLRQARRDPALFPQALGFIAATAGCFAAGAWTGPHLPTGIALIAYPAALACLLALPFAARRSAGYSAVLMLAFGAVTGLLLARTAAYYAMADPRFMWQASGVAGLFTAACGLAAYLARPGLAPLARILLSEALAMALCGIVLVSEYMALPSIGWAAITAAAYFSLAALGISLTGRARDFTSGSRLAAAVFAFPADVFFRVLRHFLMMAYDAAFLREAGVAGRGGRASIR